jgi:hypothetical protein
MIMANVYKQPLGYTKKFSDNKSYPQSLAETSIQEALIMGNADQVPSNVKNPYTSANIIGKRKK